jgi:hypothetical protein
MQFPQDSTADLLDAEDRASITDLKLPPSNEFNPATQLQQEIEPKETQPPPPSRTIESRKLNSDSRHFRFPHSERENKWPSTGFMPDPETLRDYERVLPGCAERIVRSYEAATLGPSNRNDRLVDAQIWIRKIGAGCAYILASLSFVAALAFFGTGNDRAGWSFLGAPILLTLLTKVLSTGKQ